jgi:5'-nucleotidase
MRSLLAPSTAALVLLLWLPSLAAQESARQSAPLTILQINDVYTASPVDGGKAGGLARVAKLKQQLAAPNKTVLLLMAGDFLSPSVASSVFKGKQMVDALNAAGLDIATIGNHEFDFGPDVLRERMRESRWQWVVSNIVDEDSGQPIGGAAPYLVRQYGSLKVGYLGLCIIGDEISRDKRRGVTLTDPFEAARKYIPLLQQEGVNAIVALTHLDYADDRKLAEMFPAIDVIIGGHEHAPITTVVNRTLISKAGADSRFAARIDLAPMAGDTRVERHFELVPIVQGMAEDEPTLKVTADYEARLGKELGQVIGRTTTPLDAVAEHVRSAESNLGNLFADAVREAMGADVAILNGGSIRSNRVFPVGNLTRGDVLAMHPFGSVSCKVEVSGSTILAALNHGVGRLGESLGRFPQVSGLTLRVVPSAPPGARVQDVRIGGAPLDPERRYTLAITEYMLQGGDGYSMFADARVLVGPSQGDLLVSSLEALIRARSVVSPAVERRISFAELPVTTVTKRPVILDTDMSIDGVIGMLYLLKAPEVSVRAVTIVHGMSAVATGAQNARRVLERTGNGQIPVGAGSIRPLQGHREFPASLRAQADALGGAQLPRATGGVSRIAAPDLILRELLSSPDPVTIVAMGPLTNVALALAKNPSAAKQIREIVVMGGAIEVEGNVYKLLVGLKNTVAEWNVYLDPQALVEVLATGVPVRLIPLDATRTAPVTPQFVNRIRTSPRDEASNFLLSLLEAVNPQIEDGSYYFWDVVAAVAVAQPDTMGNHEARIEVVTDEGQHFGQTRAVSTGGFVVRVGEEINREALENHLLNTILR